MRLRVAELQTAGTEGWAQLTEEQRRLGHFSVIQGMQEEIDDPSWSLCAAIAGRFRFSFRRASGSLRLVVGSIRATETETMHALLAQALPAESRTESIDALARMVCEDDDTLSLFSTETEAVQVTCVRVSLPFIRADGELAFVRGTVAALGNLVLVCWQDRNAEELEAAAQVDGLARSMRYLGRPQISAAELCSRYVAQVLVAHADASERFIDVLDSWETAFTANMTEVGTRFDVTGLSALRTSANRLQSSIRTLSSGTRRPLDAAWWSTRVEGEPVQTAEVERATRAATDAVAALRARVADAIVLAHTVGTVQSLAVARAAERASGRLQSSVTYLSAFLLVPGLVFAVFGADVWLPGGDGAGRLACMFGIAAVCAIATLVVLRYVARRPESAP